MNEKKLTLLPLALMCVTSVFMFANIPRSFLLMGYSAIPWYILSAITFFVPFAFMVAEFGAAFQSEKGGIYSWMKNSVGPRYAFIGIFMWYIGWLVWVVNTCSSIWIHFSTILFGKDTTASWSLFGLSSTQTIGILATVFVIVLTLTVTKGLDKVIKVTSLGGLSVAVINLLAYAGAIVALVAHHGHIAQPLGIEQLMVSPNPGYESIISIFSFAAFSILAYGGIEVVAGVADKTENPEKTFPRGILIGAAFIAIAYALGILVVGTFTNWNEVLSGKNVNMANAAIVVMTNMGYYIGTGFGFDQAESVALGAWVGRLVGLSMFLTYVGCLISVSYNALKQMIEGTPAKMWPGKLGQLEDGLPKNAMWAQCGLIVVFVLLVSFGGENANHFFNKLIIMTNVAMTIPYMFITGAFPSFKKSAVAKPFVLFKTYTSSLVWAAIATFTVGFANFFCLIEPAVHGDLSTTLWTAAGPVVFSIIAVLIYRRYEKICALERQSIPKIALDNRGV